MTLRPYSAIVLALGGVIQMGLGIYFVFLRPPLLPEDPRYMGASLSELQAAVPGLLTWLGRVFWVTLAPRSPGTAAARQRRGSVRVLDTPAAYGDGQGAAQVQVWADTCLRQAC